MKRGPRTDYHQGIGETYPSTCHALPCREAPSGADLHDHAHATRGRRSACRYIRTPHATRPNCMHACICTYSISAYILSAPKANMAARLSPPPPPRVTAAVVDIAQVQSGEHILAKGFISVLERGMIGHTSSARQPNCNRAE